MRRLLLPAALLLLAGCVERLISIRSEPPGAEVYLDDEKVGETPCEVEYIWYGEREIEVRKRGYKGVREFVSLDAPWWQFFPFDFITDVVLPFTITDLTELSFVLEREPASEAEVAPILKRADELRRRLKDPDE